MASAYSRRWRRFLNKVAPFLFKTGPCGNRHWRWDRYCFCRENEYHGAEWHGGIWDFKHGVEMHRCQLARLKE